MSDREKKVNDALDHASSLRFPENVLADEVVRLRAALSLPADDIQHGCAEAITEAANASFQAGAEWMREQAATWLQNGDAEHRNEGWCGYATGIAHKIRSLPTSPPAPEVTP